VGSRGRIHWSHFVDVSQLTQVKFARDGFDTSMVQATDGEDILGHPVLAAYAQVAPLGWLVFVELPKSEAYAPLNRSILLSILPRGSLL
jgi:hypothetical protein